MKNTTKKAFGKIFKVMCDSTYSPQDNDWESLIAQTTNGGWGNPSDSFRSTGKTPNVEGKIIGFYIPPNSQKNHPRFAFIRSSKGLFALKFWEAEKRENYKDRPYWLPFFLYLLYNIYYKIITSHCACSLKYSASSKLPTIES